MSRPVSSTPKTASKAALKNPLRASTMSLDRWRCALRALGSIRRRATVAEMT
jgi:hypothetical protein